MAENGAQIMYWHCSCSLSLFHTRTPMLAHRENSDTIQHWLLFCSWGWWWWWFLSIVVHRSTISDWILLKVQRYNGAKSVYWNEYRWRKKENRLLVKLKTFETQKRSTSQNFSLLYKCSVKWMCYITYLWRMENWVEYGISINMKLLINMHLKRFDSVWKLFWIQSN